MVRQHLDTLPPGAQKVPGGEKIVFDALDQYFMETTAQLLNAAQTRFQRLARSDSESMRDFVLRSEVVFLDLDGLGGCVNPEGAAQQVLQRLHLEPMRE